MTKDSQWTFPLKISALLWGTYVYLNGVNIWISFTVVSYSSLFGKWRRVVILPRSSRRTYNIPYHRYVTELPWWWLCMSILYYFQLLVLYHKPTSTTIRPTLLRLAWLSILSPYTIAICMHSCFLHDILVRQQFRLNKGYTSPTALRPAEIRAVHVTTANFVQFIRPT